jgi:hypothetical protein
LAREPGAANPHDGYGLWYEQNELQAVVSGDGHWKLVLPHRYRTLAGRPGGHDGTPAKYENRVLTEPLLFDLPVDRGETTDVAAIHPSEVKRLLALAENYRAELGDALTHRTGKGTREAGRVTAPPQK